MERKMTFTCPRCGNIAELNNSNQIWNSPPTNSALVLCNNCLTLTVLDVNSGRTIPCTPEILQEQSPEVIFSLLDAVLAAHINKIWKTACAQNSAMKN